ncbi:MAG: hypothetical protein V2A74_10510, partial [bacterium]
VLLTTVVSLTGCHRKTPYEEYLEQQAALLKAAEQQERAKRVLMTETPQPAAPIPANALQPTPAPTAASGEPVELHVYAVKNRVQILLTNKTSGNLSFSPYSFGVIQGRTLTKFNPTFVTNEFPVGELPPGGQSVGFLTFRELGDLVGARFVFYHPDFKPVAVTIQPMPEDSPAFPVVIPPPRDLRNP